MADAGVLEDCRTWWDPALETGDRMVDLQHMQLFATTNDLLVASVAGAGRRDISNAVFDLLRYAGRHFADEEALMVASGYPGLAEQRLAHERFAAEVNRLATDYLTDSNSSVNPLARFIHDWLRDHVDTLDRSLAEHLHADRPGRRSWR